MNKHVRSYEPDLPLPGSGVARELSLLETKSPRRVVWHFAIFLSSYTYKGHGPPKSFCGPPIGNQCLMLNERWHVRFLWSFTQTLHRISKLSIDNSVPQGQKGCDVPDTKFSGASIGQDKAHAALYLRTRFHRKDWTSGKIVKSFVTNRFVVNSISGVPVFCCTEGIDQCACHVHDN